MICNKCGKELDGIEHITTEATHTLWLTIPGSPKCDILYQDIATYCKECYEKVHPNKYIPWKKEKKEVIRKVKDKKEPKEDQQLCPQCKRLKKKGRQLVERWGICKKYGLVSFHKADWFWAMEGILPPCFKLRKKERS